MGWWKQDGPVEPPTDDELLLDMSLPNPHLAVTVGYFDHNQPPISLPLTPEQVAFQQALYHGAPWPDRSRRRRAFDWVGYWTSPTWVWWEIRHRTQCRWSAEIGRGMCLRIGVSGWTRRQCERRMSEALVENPTWKITRPPTPRVR